MKTKLGTNQYKKKYNVRARAVLLAVPVAIALYVAYNAVVFFIKSFRTLKNPVVYLLILTLLITSKVSAIAPKDNLTESYQSRTAYQVPTLNPNLTEREQNIELIQKIWGSDAQIGLAIARCESGYRTAGPHVANKDHSVDQGVFSINSVHGMPEMEVAVANISYAYILFQQQGTNPWTSSESCWR